MPEGVGLGPEGIATNGIATNGIATNGIATNGIATNGIQINGQTLEAVLIGGATSGSLTFTNVSLNATVFSGTRSDGAAVSGNGFVGVSFVGALASGATKKLRVDARVQLSGAGAGLSAYDVTYLASSGVRKHLCGLDAGGQPVLAIPVAGEWNYQQGVPGGGAFTADPTRFTFACRGAAIAKCVELGYRPWQSVAGGGTLENHLAACTRALRADFCGDGRSWTVNGTTINIYDGVGVQADTESWGVEAEWTPEGARFVADGPGNRSSLLGGTPPACLPKLASLGANDASPFATGALLVTEFKY